MKPHLENREILFQSTVVLQSGKPILATFSAVGTHFTGDYYTHQSPQNADMEVRSASGLDRDLDREGKIEFGRSGRS